MVGSWRAFVRFGFIAAQNRRWLWVGFPIVFGPSQGLLTNRSTGRKEPGFLVSGCSRESGVLSLGSAS